MRLSGIAKSFILIVFVNRKHLVIKRWRQTDPAIRPPLRSPASTPMPERGRPLSLNPTPACNATSSQIQRPLEPGPAIHKEEVLHRVIGDEEIHPAIIIYIRGDYTQALSQSF